MEFHKIQSMFFTLIFEVIYDSVFCFFSEKRFQQLIEKFKADYNGTQPQFLCRAPGRVNLIGNIN